MQTLYFKLIAESHLCDVHFVSMAIGFLAACSLQSLQLWKLLFFSFKIWWTGWMFYVTFIRRTLFRHFPPRPVVGVSFHGDASLRLWGVEKKENSGDGCGSLTHNEFEYQVFIQDALLCAVNCSNEWFIIQVFCCCDSCETWKRLTLERDFTSHCLCFLCLHTRNEHGRREFLQIWYKCSLGLKTALRELPCIFLHRNVHLDSNMKW